MGAPLFDCSISYALIELVPCSDVCVLKRKADIWQSTGI